MDHISMPPLHLVDLPNELLDQIAQYLDYTSTLATRWTCRSLFSRLKPKELPTVICRDRIMYDMADLHKLECWPCFTVSAPSNQSLSVYSSKLPPRNLYACGDCRHLRPVSSFSLAMIKGNQAKNKHPGVRRFCIPCGVKDGPYKKGTRLRFIREDDTVMSLRNAMTKKQAVAKEITDTRSDKSPEEGVIIFSSRKGGESSPGFSSSSDMVIGTAIVCQRCGQFKIVENYSRECIRRRCTECLIYRPPGMG